VIIVGAVDMMVWNKRGNFNFSYKEKGHRKMTFLYLWVYVVVILIIRKPTPASFRLLD
jgi:hypothetical protein